MGATTRLSYEEWRKLPEPEGAVYELDERELLMEPSPALRHNLIRQRIGMRLTVFVRRHRLGIVVGEMDFRLGPDTVRNPDIAFIAADRLMSIDPDRSPVEGGPDLAVEVVSPDNLAQDMAKKVGQYFASGCRAVWVVYPSLRVVERHDSSGIRKLTERETLEEETIFATRKFSVPLAKIFDPDLQK